MSNYSRFGILVLGSILTCSAEAWVAAGRDGYHGGYYGGYNHGYYYGNGWAAHGAVIGVPEGAYYGYGCGLVQTCGAAGCVNHRICE